MVTGRVIINAGREAAPKAGAGKREAIGKIRAALRNSQASDEDVDDALEALVELAKSED